MTDLENFIGASTHVVLWAVIGALVLGILISATRR